MSCCERDGLGDKSVQERTNQREDRKTMNQKMDSVKETSTTSPSKCATRMNNQENGTMWKKNCNTRWERWTYYTFDCTLYIFD